MSGNLIIISSPSGGGKGTLIKEVRRRVDGLGYSVSYTTREPREGEEDGRDYFFVSRDEFERRISEGEFLESAEVHGNLYGTSRLQVDRELSGGRDIILEIDVQGALAVLDSVPDAVSIFILPPSFEVLRDRLSARGTESESSLELRLANARGEVGFSRHFRYVVVNDELERAVADLESVIRGERLRFDRQTERIQGILDSFDGSDAVGR